jgi:hypothetical protein
LVIGSLMGPQDSAGDKGGGRAHLSAEIARRALRKSSAFCLNNVTRGGRIRGSSVAPIVSQRAFILSDLGSRSWRWRRGLWPPFPASVASFFLSRSHYFCAVLEPIGWQRNYYLSGCPGAARRRRADRALSTATAITKRHSYAGGSTICESRLWQRGPSEDISAGEWAAASAQRGAVDVGSRPQIRGDVVP